MTTLQSRDGSRGLSASAELRYRIASLNAVATHIDLELTHESFLSDLHPAYGLGIRGIARPFVVAYIDLGYGSVGLAAFTGINYPF